MSDVLCRDCFTWLDAPTKACPQCGSHRVAVHDELRDLTIAHLDCDAFYASVEKRDDPSIRDKPVVVGGGKRGVVSAACYIARMSGVHSAMPMFKALKACPSAVVIKPNMQKYVEVSREIKDRMRALTPLVEPLSLDEAFLDLSGTERLHKMVPAEQMVRLANRIEDEVGITVSVGLSFNKFLAKVASDLDKPRGLSVIGRAEALDFLARQPVNKLWGVGRAFEAKLKRDGILSVGQVQKMAETDLMRRYGVMGQHIWRLSQALDRRRVHMGAERKSISNETTFFDDIANKEELERILWRLSESVATSAKKKETSGKTITLKLRTTDFKIRTRSRTLEDPTMLADVIFSVGRELLAPEVDGTPFRLIGIGISALDDAVHADPPDLIDPERGRRAAAERAMDQVRGKFGKDKIGKGRGLKRPQQDG